MQVLVTGGAGYIGSHTCKALAAAGHEPIVFDNLSVGSAENVKWGPLIVGDLKDESLIRNTLTRYRISAVIHFAASAYVGESVWNPSKYYRNNVVNSLNLIDAMVHTGVKRIVFSSTCATFGTPEQIPITESHPQRPVNPYGESKLAIERALDWYGGAYDLNFVALRYFNASGCDPDGDLGEEHDPETHLIPLAIQAALGEVDHLNVFGTDYPTPDGSAVRDFIHVTDLADAHVRALDRLVATDETARFNLGTGTGYSVLDVIRAVEKETGRRVPVKYGPRRVGDPAMLVADPSRAGEALGWKPQHSGLDEIVHTATGYFQRVPRHQAAPLRVAAGD